MTANALKRTKARPYAAADREAASTLLGDIRPLDAPGSHVHVLDFGGVAAVQGVAVWLEASPGSDEAYLGPVIAPGVGPNLEFYQLILACADDALASGYERAYFTLKDRGLERLFRISFDIEAVATGWETEGGQPREWEVHVELRNAIEQLLEMIAALDRSGVR